MKYDWSKLTPREKDALVAERVMGYTNIHELQTLDDRTHLWGRPTPTRGSTIIPYYTTDIAAAWTIVTAMRSDCWDMNFHIVEDAWECEFVRSTVDSTITIALSAPEAICLAALRAVGVDV